MKRRFMLYFTIVVLLLCCLGLSGKQLNLVSSFGDDLLMLPRQIMVSGEEIFILDEYGNMTPGDEKIKIFSLEGKLKTEFGRAGQGPGEFGAASSFYIFKKKIYIMDSFRRMVHIFSEKDKKHLDSKTVYFGPLNAPYTTPSELLVTPDGSIYYNAARSTKGQKLITRLVEESVRKLKPRLNFLDCIPEYKNTNEAYSIPVKEKDQHAATRKGYTNHGYIAAVDSKIYFTFWLIDKVYELSTEGKILNQYTLPIESIINTVEVIKVGRFHTIERKLNYDLLSRNGQVYVLSRDKNGDSVVFQLEKGKFSEKYRMKEKLFSFDISGNRLYGIERDECKVLVYDLK